MSDLVITPMGARFYGRHLPCTIGRGGITDDKFEGDMATPRGRHRIVALYYRPDRIACPAQWAQPIGLNALWSDDPDDPAYNHLVQAPHPFGHETLRRADPMYDLILTTDWNWPKATPGKGSAIFVHTWRRPGYPTAGCVAFARQDLMWIIQRAGPGTGLVIDFP
jgi:L,D-peptidoglycan transpeptidase YkuD (ErfK/YbiS/YcfS/YnhG family)